MGTRSHQGIILLGLGPGEPSAITRAAWNWLENTDELHVRTSQHPVMADLPANLKVISFDQVYEESQDFDQVYEKIIAEVLSLGQRPQGVTYAVPGHPFVAEATCPEIRRRAEAMGIPVRVIDGLSFLEPSFVALGLDPFPQLALVDALELARSHHPPFPPGTAALIAQIYSRAVAADVKLTLNAVYPDTHPVRLVHAAGTDYQVVEDLQLYEIDRSRHLGLLSSLYLPPLPVETSFEAFQEIVARLRAPDGCPWDREQTHLTLRQHLMEESYETLAAIDSEDSDALCEELGDLLLQIVLHAQISSEDGEFGMSDVIAGIHRKIVRRHPHVFGDLSLDGVDGVLKNWEKLKAEERKQNGDGQKGILDGVPAALPALAQAQEIQERAARVGFDWGDVTPVIGKVREELAEVMDASDEDKAEELGDLVFAVVNLSRWYGIEAESALRATNLKFRRRFAYIERHAREAGRELSAMTLEEMDALWEQAKGEV
ncbi:MAG: nucleoside triphosphate pyrophosphohydrolase [Anaerolineae bacterium]|nr:nucleoside triphosphate pyrophosphohydrolase [Anaerolineae bacterium]